MAKKLEPAYGGHDHFGIGHGTHGETYAKVTGVLGELSTNGNYLNCC
jgi:hypothetical protein